ncbi:MAG: SMC family ATPase, partial [Clostridia bacterium]|nr:SMC family ATPase [Clostridia bacterium]
FIAEQEKEPIREKLAGNISKLMDALPQYEKVEKLKKEKEKQEKVLQALDHSLDLLRKQKETLSAKMNKLKKEQNELYDVDTCLLECKNTLTNLELRKTHLNTIADEITSLKEMQEQYTKLQKAYLEAEQNYNAANDEYTKKEAEFFREQAGILAESLKEGDPCPVCGSIEHPHKAQSTADAPSEADIKKLKSNRDKKQEIMHQTSEIAGRKKTQIETSQTHLFQSALSVFAKDIPESLLGLESLVQNELMKTIKIQQEQTEERIVLEAKCALKTASLEELNRTEETFQKTEELYAQQSEKKGNLVALLTGIKSEIETLQAVLEYPSMDKTQKTIVRIKGELNALKNALQEAENAYQKQKRFLDNNQTLLYDQKNRLADVSIALNKAWTEYTAKYQECGFADQSAYHKALLSEEALAELKKNITNYWDEYKCTKADLTRLSRETKDKQPMDTIKIKAEQNALQLEKTNLDEKIQRVIARLQNNEKIVMAITKAQRERQKLEKDYLVVSNLAKTANGELAGKQKLAFEQYVQASYFNQIIAEANKRLRAMSNGRYELLRKENAKDFRSHSGLELDVLDNYTGKIRTVKSLSGGESFKASLSLALGLSDVMQSYAGGVEIDTMFIDEGFGALDSESLEQAIITLNSLAFGNRLVGIISHVNELKDRIDNKVVIKKSIDGSVIEFVG